MPNYYNMSSIISNEYQPSLFVSGVPEHFTYDDICDRVDDRDWGRVKSVVLLPVSKKVTYGPNVRSVIVHYTFWFRECEPELRDLSRGKYLRLFYNKTEYWKAIAYDPSRQKSKKNSKKPEQKKSETVKPLQHAPVQHTIQSENMKSIINVISSSVDSVEHEDASVLALAKEIMMEALAITEKETPEKSIVRNQQELERIQGLEKNYKARDSDYADISSIPTPDYGDAILPPPRTNRGKITTKKVTIVVQPAQDSC